MKQKRQPHMFDWIGELLGFQEDGWYCGSKDVQGQNSSPNSCRQLSRASVLLGNSQGTEITATCSLAAAETSENHTL